MRKIVLVGIALLLTGIAGPSRAFDIDGFHTGMSVNEAREYAEEAGLTMKQVSSSTVYWMFDGNHLFESLVFCDGGLTSVLKNIDFDADYINTLQEMIQGYGTTTRVWTERQAAWNDIYSAKSLWVSGDDKVILSFSPDGRTGNGALRYPRHASLSFETRSHCSMNDWK